MVVLLTEPTGFNLRNRYLHGQIEKAREVDAALVLASRRISQAFGTSGLVGTGVNRPSRQADTVFRNRPCGTRGTTPLRLAVLIPQDGYRGG